MTTAPPTPPDTDAAAFVAALRRLKAWSGLSYRQLERRATEAGHTLPYSTAATMLGRDRLPRGELVAAFVAACGVRADEAEAWLDARVAIACGPPAETPPVPRNSRSRPRRRTLAMAVAVATALLGGVTATGTFTDDVEVEQTRTSLHLPRS
ncbi:hypothetical protein RM704_16760 [Streptomyces sp. DSM 3412]|uniref:Helix-turn-helix domain-containing protein n=1 Tax=Streptomyces gottesmaniae TaxID=3075518 RepID=A0ABU2YYX8_9ACTN|nr:hypothetical protein [Streptomyces sp. DSM 3412]MDT0569103.1 hypothetical protein [Streptomyces sp. DSM 3412]